jgi:NAD(P)-dependent dehydrogenase (short-subunit alcohol dehydrogenase family)
MATVIIGCAGTGAAVARRLASSGKPLILLSRNGDKLKALAEPLNASYRVVDVLDIPAFEETLKSLASNGPLAGLVYAVGSIPLKPLKATSALDFLDAYKLNTLGAALALKHLAPALAGGASPGSVVLYSTVAAGTGFPNHTAIATAKGGIEALARSAAAELSPKVRINVVSPSLTDTPLASRMTSNEAMRKSLGDAHPIPRLGTLEDLSAMTCFLLNNEQSGWISGQTFAVDGGRSTLRPKN